MEGCWAGVGWLGGRGLVVLCYIDFGGSLLTRKGRREGNEIIWEGRGRGKGKGMAAAVFCAVDMLLFSFRHTCKYMSLFPSSFSFLFSSQGVTSCGDLGLVL